MLAERTLSPSLPPSGRSYPWGRGNLIATNAGATGPRPPPNLGLLPGSGPPVMGGWGGEGGQVEGRREGLVRGRWGVGMPTVRWGRASDVHWTCVGRALGAWWGCRPPPSRLGGDQSLHPIQRVQHVTQGISPSPSLPHVREEQCPPPTRDRIPASFRRRRRAPPTTSKPPGPPPPVTPTPRPSHPECEGQKPQNLKNLRGRPAVHRAPGRVVESDSEVSGTGGGGAGGTGKAARGASQAQSRLGPAVRQERGARTLGTRLLGSLPPGPPHPHSVPPAA
jgi:hypothetical protein